MATRRVINLSSRQVEQLSGLVRSDEYNNPIPTQSFASEALIVQPVNTLSTGTTVDEFGTYQSNTESYPNDSLQLNVFNAANQYLETDYRVNAYTKDGSEVTIDVEKSVSDLGYISGKYKTEYRFIRNYLGSQDGHKLLIQEVSVTGLEVRVVPVLSDTLSNDNFVSFFAEGFFKLPKSKNLPNLFLFKDALNSFKVFDYVQDSFSVPESPFSIIFKLAVPIGTNILVGDVVWIGQEVSEAVVDEVTITPPKLKTKNRYIAGPNWDATKNVQQAFTTQYKDWDDVLSTTTQTSNDIVNKLLSGSLIENIPLNIDFKVFENFITFGSATERLQNFKYKLQLLENYNSRIDQLTTSLNGLLSGSASSSFYYTENVTDATTKRAALLGGFDSYERYLYFESSSYESSSYGEFYPTTWPKSNNTKPYTNYSVTSSQAEEWFDGIITSASLYDQNNEKALYKLVPAHVLEDPTNEEYVLFTNMIGHYFDLIFTYVKQATLIYNRDQSLLEGFSKELVYHVAQSLGIDFNNGNSLDDLWSYALGTDVTGSLSSTYAITSDERTKEVWKRVINNLPYLIKTKGTERGVRALINCYGIPTSILRIREYGGVEPDFDTKTDLVYERFNYALNLKYNVTQERVIVPWLTLNENSKLPMSIQLRVKMAKNQTKDQTIIEVPNQWKIQAFQSASGNYVGFFLRSGSAGSTWATASVSSSIYDGTFHNITLQRSNETDNSGSNQTYSLIIKKTNYQKVVATHTASLVINGATSASYNSAFTQTSSLYIPSAVDANTNFTGSVQEFRYWTKPLQDSILNNHALAPTSFQGNQIDTYTGSTSSYYDLSFRLCLGSDDKKINYNLTSSFSSQHPNQYNNVFGNVSLTAKSASFSNFSNISYEPINEIHSLEFPDLGANRSVGNKIRIDSTLLASNQLYRNTKVERSLTDQQPPDSPRLGVFLSPTNEINQDIAEQFGGISIDDFIGDPTYLTLDNYPALDKLKFEYSKKYTGRNTVQNYIRLIKHFDASLFQLIKKMVPYRANTQVGLVIEPTILERSKVAVNVPTTEDLHYSASIQIPDVYTTNGAVQDGANDPFRNIDDYVQEATINSIETVIIDGTAQQIIEDSNVDGALIDAIQYVQLRGNANEFNNGGVADLPTVSGSLTGEIDFGVSSYGRDVRVLGSQYTFTTYATSGSGSTRSEPYLVSSSRYDYSEALNPVILTSRFSDTTNLTNNVYDVNIFNKKAFSGASAFTESVAFADSSRLQDHPFTRQYGLRLQDTYLNNVNVTPYSPASWSLSDTTGLQFYIDNSSETYNNQPLTGSVLIDAFFYDTPFHNPYVVESLTHTHDYLYKIDLTVHTSENTLFTLYFGDFSSNLTQSFTVNGSGGSPVTYSTSFITKATGNQLGLRSQFKVIKPVYAVNNVVRITKLAVQCLNYRSDTQDFHLQHSKGMVNARYEGCKLTSPDYNVNSNDTIDRGPVITITPVNPNQLAINPRVRPATTRQTQRARR